MMRTRLRFLVLPLALFLTVGLFGCDGGPSSSSPADDDVTLDFSGSFDGEEIVLERVVNDTPDGRVVIDLVATRVEFDARTGFAELDVALRNVSPVPAALPAYVFVGDFSPSGTRVTNSDNQLIDPLPGTVLPQGPYPDWFDYSATFGEDAILAPRETSSARTWRVDVEGSGSFAFGAAVRIGTDVERASVGGRVFLDSNGNGAFDDDELPFGAGIVELSGPAGFAQRTQVMDDGTWRLPIRRAGLYTAEFVPPPSFRAPEAPFAPWCSTTPNPLEIAVASGVDGRPISFDGADFGLAEYPCDDPPASGVVNLTSSPPDSIPTDHFALIDARVIASPGVPDGSTTWFVEVRVGFSGCDGGHPFLAFAGDDFMDTNPPSTWLRLQHDGRGELCEAWFEETRLFDLTPLVRRYREIYGPGAPNFTMELTAPNGTTLQLALP